MTTIKGTEETAVKIEVGTPVTYCIRSDRYSGEVISFTKSKKTLVVKLRGGSEPGLARFRLRKCGRYREVGSDSGYLWIGVANDYRDPSF